MVLDIHEIMLKDSIRTDAYRDFIYDHKALFKDRIVLDVGCGTGILSMMCARAGAKRVLAVDNSNIIHKARENVFENGLQDVISCLHGKIEEISLPVPKVDIIISEWMGYALLYEAMLDSVLFARDRYLAPGGLIVPSHTTIFIAPLVAPDLVADRITFWHDVYGFKMPAMMEKIYDDVILKNISEDELAGEPKAVVQFPMHTTRATDLTFDGAEFTHQLSKEVDVLDGFVLWFDTFFAKSPDEKVPMGAAATSWANGTTFTTGPMNRPTHWMQTVLLINRLKNDGCELKKGQKINGKLVYKRPEGNSRQLDISVRWEAEGTCEKGMQLWQLA